MNASLHFLNFCVFVFVFVFVSVSVFVYVAQLGFRPGLKASPPFAETELFAGLQPLCEDGGQDLQHS